MRWLALFGMVGCGAPIYFPVEPPPFAPDSAPEHTSDTGPADTGTLVPTDTGTPPWTPSTPTGGGLPCSFYGNFSASVTIRNQGPEDLTLYWRDFYCVEHHYGIIYAGTEYVQGTWQNQAWVLREPGGYAISSIVIHEANELWEVP